MANKVKIANQVKVALGQMCSGLSIEDNLVRIHELAQQAAAEGACYLQVPEMAVMFAEHAGQLVDAERDLPVAQVIERLSAIAAEAGIILHVGSMAVVVGNDKFANRAHVFGSNGALLTTYDKIHLFDADVPGQPAYRESNRYVAGDVASVIDLDMNGHVVRVGLTICFDLRFGRLFESLADAGAAVITVPAAFTQPTGVAHWEILLRARAIETGSYVFAAAQAGAHENGRATHGHSMVIDPWGRIVAQLAHRDEGLLVANLDLDLVKDARARLPVLANRRPYSVSVNHKAAN